MTQVPRKGEKDLATPPPEPPAPGAIQEGEVLAGNYVVKDVIGEGGMATVYRALQRSLSRTVALKVLHHRFARDGEFVARFEAEAGALATLQHPNIVNVIDKDSDTGRYFFVMEYVEGRTLDQMIIDDHLDFKMWRQVVESCREALDYVHKRGVVHRDIKPSNILVDKEGRVKISDFGIAHIVGGDAGEAAHLTMPARAVGTVNYMAPEQTADPANVDHRADVYSLGVTFYKMFTRMLPVGAFPSPSEANHSVPVAVDEVIFRAMCPDRDDRYQNVKEFCDDLLKALKEQTVSITSVLNYRSDTSGVLYTGDDFRSQPKVAGEKADKKDKRDKGKKDGRFRVEPTPLPHFEMTPTPGAATPLPMRLPSESKVNVPKLPADATPALGTAPTADPRVSKLRRLAIIMAALAVVLLVAVVALLINQHLAQSSPAPPLEPGSVPMTLSDRQREIERRILEERKAAEAAAQQGQTAPTETPAAEGTPAAEEPTDQNLPFLEDIPHDKPFDQ